MRDLYEIDGYHVTFEPGVGWCCDCETFEALKFCEHAGQAAAIATLERKTEELGGSAGRQ